MSTKRVTTHSLLFFQMKNLSPKTLAMVFKGQLRLKQKTMKAY